MQIKFDVTSEELSDFLDKQCRMLSGKLNDAIDRQDYTQAKTLLERVCEIDDLMNNNYYWVPNSIANVVIRVDEVATPNPPPLPKNRPSPL